MSTVDPNTLPPTMSRAMGEINRYHEYLWDKVSPHIGNRVIEIGVGFGQYSRKMLDDNKSLLGCDIDEGHLTALKSSSDSPLLQTLHLDLCTPGTGTIEKCLEFNADTIILLNVLEHIKDHEAALSFLNKAVPSGAKLIIIVPAMPLLYNGLDREAGHFRRYGKKDLQKILKDSNWSILRNEYFNMPGIPGWLIAGILSKFGKAGTELNAPSTNILLKIYDRFFVQASIVTDPFCKHIAGLNILNVSVKR